MNNSDVDLLQYDKPPEAKRVPDEHLLLGLDRKSGETFGQRQLSFLFWRQLLFPIVLGVIGPFFWRFLGLVFCFRWRRLSAARGEAAEGRRQRRVGGYPRCLIVAVVVDSYGWSSLCFVALGPVTLAVKFQDDRVMNQSIDGRHRRHRILEDFGPLAED